IDHVAINWHKELPFIRQGPFDHWAVREPENAILEVGAHALAHLIDLVGEPSAERMLVDVSRPATLPAGMVAYRHWHVHALHDDTVVDLTVSLSPGYTEHAIHVRGSLGSATCDFESDTYMLRRHTRYATDIDRFLTVTRTGVATATQASRNFSNYVLSKAKLSSEGNAFATSIRRSLEAFYAAVEGRGPVDARISGETGSRVVRLACRIGRAAPKSAPLPTRIPPRARQADILVTGGTGFIGRELVKQLLARGRRVRVVTRRTEAHPFEDCPNLEVVAGNILIDADQARALDGIRSVFHLARGSGKTYDEYLRDDVDPTRRLAEKAVALGVERFVYTSSIVVFNWADHGRVIRDDSPVDRSVHRRGCYTRAKAEAERILLRIHENEGLPVVIVRPGIVVGAGGDPCHWGVGMWQAPGVCQVWGEGNNALPFVLVQDVAAALILALDNEAAVGRTFNLVDAPMLSAREYLAEYERAGGLELQKLYTPTWRFFAADCVKYAVKLMVRHPNRTQPSWRDWNARREMSLYDTSLTRSVLGWKPAGDRERLIELGVHAAVREMLA
ncbi:MAG TPA: NAD(P)-dependent oxidoreductase, partial [Methylobacterium sp.]